MQPQFVRRVTTALAVVLATAASSATAQLRGFSIGFEGLYSNLTSTSADYSSEDEFGYRFGATVTLPRGRFFIQPGAFYQDAGFILDGPLVRDDVRVRGIHIPLVAGINLGVPKVNVELVAGPTVTFRTSINDNVFGIDSDQTNAVLFGASVGATARVLFLNATLGYDFGFTNLFTDEARTQYGDGNLNHWRLSLGFIVGG
jgi:hypothetical protein